MSSHVLSRIASLFAIVLWDSGTLPYRLSELGVLGAHCSGQGALKVRTLDVQFKPFPFQDEDRRSSLGLYSTVPGVWFMGSLPQISLPN